MEAGAQQAEMEAALPLSESAAAAETGAPKLFLIAAVSSAVVGGGCDTAGDCSCWYSNSNPLYKFRARLITQRTVLGTLFQDLGIRYIIPNTVFRY